jgi:lycopene beta-cyclase
MRMIRSGKFSDKKILLIDREPKTKNDRTWCFWESGESFFESIVYRNWPQVDFLSDTYSATLEIAPYAYKMIRGSDFYQYCITEISRHPQIETIYAEIGTSVVDESGTTLELNQVHYQLPPAVVFNSVYRPGTSRLNVLQHFKGWVIESAQPVFDPSKAFLMDFRVHQQEGTTFAYVLPFDAHRALVEYTLFTPKLLAPEQYDLELKNYIRDFLKITQYTVKEEEFGIIPMTDERFPVYQNGVIHIGTAGGQTKASSGYTFQFIQKQSDKIMELLLKGESLTRLKRTPWRFRFYDNTLLYILYHKTLPGRKIFSTLFKKNKATQVLKFLDNESTLREELGIISSLPTWPFLKAALKQLR